jgi:hypothetical protein
LSTTAAIPLTDQNALLSCDIAVLHFCLQVGATYEPLFPYFADHSSAFRVVSDGYVTDDSGTGVVHQAPAFGEDDYR